LAVSLGWVSWFNVECLIAAYRNGPPHYWPKDDVDQWAHQMPFLAILDAAALFGSTAFHRWVRRRRPASRGAKAR
jgi:hypothetical protein